MADGVTISRNTPDEMDKWLKGQIQLNQKLYGEDETARAAKNASPKIGDVMDFGAGSFGKYVTGADGKPTTVPVDATGKALQAAPEQPKFSREQLDAYYAKPENKPYPLTSFALGYADGSSRWLNNNSFGLIPSFADTMAKNKGIPADQAQMILDAGIRANDKSGFAGQAISTAAPTALSIMAAGEALPAIWAGKGAALKGGVEIAKGLGRMAKAAAPEIGTALGTAVSMPFAMRGMLDDATKTPASEQNAATAPSATAPAATAPAVAAPAVQGATQNAPSIGDQLVSPPSTVNIGGTSYTRSVDPQSKTGMYYGTDKQGGVMALSEQDVAGKLQAESAEKGRAFLPEVYELRTVNPMGAPVRGMANLREIDRNNFTPEVEKEFQQVSENTGTSLQQLRQIAAGRAAAGWGYGLGRADRATAPVTSADVAASQWNTLQQAMEGSIAAAGDDPKKKRVVYDAWTSVLANINGAKSGKSVDQALETLQQIMSEQGQAE